MARFIIGLLLVFISMFSVAVYGAGSHGYFAFRPWMLEDWLIWGTALITGIAGTTLLIVAYVKSTKRSLKYNRNETLNVGLDMAMEFGDNWLQPINDSLKKKYDYLTDNDLQEYTSICQAAMSEGHRYIYSTLEVIVDKGETITEAELEKQFKLNMEAEFSWISKWNLRKLYSQGCYYAWKDGLDNAIK